MKNNYDITICLKIYSNDDDFYGLFELQKKKYYLNVHECNSNILFNTDKDETIRELCERLLKVFYEFSFVFGLNEIIIEHSSYLHEKDYLQVFENGQFSLYDLSINRVKYLRELTKGDVHKVIKIESNLLKVQNE